MKRAEERTAYILVQAYTNSGWDDCEFAIVPVTDAWLQTLRRRWEQVQNLLDDVQFANVNYYECTAVFFACNDEQDAVEFLKDNEAWGFVQTDEAELKEWPKPKNRLHAYTMHMDKYGSVRFKAYGKHTGEPFYTEAVSISELLTVCETGTKH